MRKRIAIFTCEVAGEFQQTNIKAIIHKANALDYDVSVFCAYGSYNDDLLYSEGEKAVIYLPDCAQFDGIIVTEDLFDNPGMGDELYAILQKQATCPVVYLRTKREGFYSILLENKKSMENVVRHFTDVHGFTDICYMSGKKGLIDTEERLQGYLDVMAEKGININEHMIFHGNYWRDKGAEAVDWFFAEREFGNYPQAIVCANDYMAISICEELLKRGIRVPEDVCVSGFDFIPEARTYEPTITSLQVDFEVMSERAMVIIDNVNHGIAEEQIQYIEAKLISNKSCGCGSQYRVKNVSELLNENHRQTNGIKNIMLSTIEYQDAFGFDEYMAVADKYRGSIPSEKIYVVFNDIKEQGATDVENDSAFTENMVLLRVFEGYAGRQFPSRVFARKELLPEEYWEKDVPNNLFFFPMHFKNKVYGYIVATMPEADWFNLYTQVYMLTLSNAIANSDAHSKLEELEVIRSLYQKDALTGIYNRRGFDKLLRDKFFDAREYDKDVVVVSIDMDSLKEINDTLGHAYGDKAIVGLAEVLDSVMLEDEFCARIGGDEFAAVLLPGEDTELRVKEFREAFEAAVDKKNEKIEKYTLGASVGLYSINEDKNASLTVCIQRADKRMYEEKRRRKAGRQ